MKFRKSLRDLIIYAKKYNLAKITLHIAVFSQYIMGYGACPVRNSSLHSLHSTLTNTDLSLRGKSVFAYIFPASSRNVPTNTEPDFVPKESIPSELKVKAFSSPSQRITTSP